MNLDKYFCKKVHSRLLTVWWTRFTAGGPVVRSTMDRMRGEGVRQREIEHGGAKAWAQRSSTCVTWNRARGYGGRREGAPKRAELTANSGRVFSVLGSERRGRQPR